MNETKPSETKPKKMVSRNVAIALGIICIVLVAGIIGVTEYFTKIHNDYVSSHTYSNDEYTLLKRALYDNIEYYTSQIQNLTNILNVEKIFTHDYYGIPLPANFTNPTALNEYALDYIFQETGGSPIAPREYPGIFSVQVSSTSNQTYVYVTYSTGPGVEYFGQYTFPQFIYGSQTDTGYNGTVTFPFVPYQNGARLIIRIAVHDVNIAATANVTLTYYY